MTELKKDDKDKEIWGLFSGGDLIFQGSYEACKQEAQRQFEKFRKKFHDHEFLRQDMWERRGGRDDDRDRF